MLVGIGGLCRRSFIKSNSKQNKRHSRRSAHLYINQKENQKKMRIFPPSLYPKLLIYTQTYMFKCYSP